MLKTVVIALIVCAFAANAGASGRKTGDATPSTEWAARVQRDTERYRKGDAVIRVVDRAGRPVEGASIKAEQLTHDFLFGCNIYMFDRLATPEQNARYKELFKGVMNYATLPFYWRGFERERGKPGYAYIDKVARWCRENGVTAKGHPLVWTHEAGVPTWLPEDRPDEVRRLLEARVREIVSRYKGLIGVWDVVNESTHTRTFADMSVFDYTSLPVRWAEEANPEAMLIVNEFGVIGDTKGTGAFFKLLKQMKDAGVPYDAVGIQTHMHGRLLSLPTILETLDKFAELGKPIHFTETTVLSGRETSDPAEEKKQAAYVEKFYRVCFSHPAVKAITWWDFSDAGAWQRVAAGLVRKDMTPKPVYRVLDRLINKEWRTSVEGRTGADGTYSFRGFGGEYRVEVTIPSGEMKTAESHVAEQKMNSIEVRM